MAWRRGFGDNLAMRRIEIKQLDYDLTPVGGLALVGHYLRAMTPQWARRDGELPLRGGVSNSDVLRSYLGLLVQGKSDFDAVENYRGDKFFKEALCPLAAYLGSHSFRLELALRPGVQHFTRETDFNLERVIPLAQRLSAAGPKAQSLARLDSGFDPAALMRSVEACNQSGQPQVDWLIKWNPRSVDRAALLARLDAEPSTRWHKPRAGKRVTVWEEAIKVESITRPLRRVFRLIERDIDRSGRQLIVPEIELEGWTTSLLEGQFSADKIMAPYADHGTHEQFYSEFKTDLDLERLPSGKFDTNYLVCQLAALAMNILRLMGQRGLLGPDAPVRHPAKRRRIKTVIHELIYRAGRLIEHGRRLILGLGANDRAAKAFARLNGELFAASS